jgi:fungal nitric oxide reductase
MLTAVSQIRELLDYIANLVDQRTAEPKEDLISKLVVEQV